MKNPIFKETTNKLRTVLNEGLRFKSPIEDIQREMTQHVLATREALVMAWVAETGISPSEAVICHGIRDGHSRMWVECKSTVDICCDHIIPYSKGGKTILSNLRALCRKCNTARGNSPFPTPIEL